MRFIGVRELRQRSAKVWKDLAHDREVVITSNGKPIAILSSVVEERLEEELRAIRRAKALDAIASIHEDSLRAGGDRITLEEINREIAAVRKERRK